jgi:hypothetical protein
VDRYPDTDAWINDARRAGLPVLLTGMLLFAGCLGVPLWLYAICAALVMGLVLVVGVRVTFSRPDAEDPDQ